MKPRLRTLRAQSRPICQFCDYILQQPGYRRSFVASSVINAPSISRQPPLRHGVLTTTSRRPFRSSARWQEEGPEIEHPTKTRANVVSLNAQLGKVEEHMNAIYNSPRIESEAVILQVLESLQSIARQAIAIRTGQPPRAKLNLRQSSAGAILSLDAEDPPTNSNIKGKSGKLSISKNPLNDDLPPPAHLSTLAEEFLKHEKVFIAPAVLSKYVDLQILLGRPRAIPEIFYLYANKPVPRLGSSPPKFSKPSPRGHKQAIPSDIAASALSAAISAKDMSLALSVIDTTYCAPAWRSHQIMRKVVPPGIVAAIIPIALYKIAEEFSLYSGYIDPWLFKMYSFAGLLTYVGCTGTLGFVALTTHNDHHDRVVWRPGIPLSERWLREDERAALDRIAGAWGFKETWKRGDEEGEEWEGLRQWILLRGMILDKADLMPGMNA